MTESLVAQGMAQCGCVHQIAVTEVWPLKDGAMVICNGAVTECLAAKGGIRCARVGSKGIVECTSERKLQWVEFPGCYGARTDGYGRWDREAVGVPIQWERAEMSVELRTVVRS